MDFQQRTFLPEKNKNAEKQTKMKTDQFSMLFQVVGCINEKAMFIGLLVVNSSVLLATIGDFVSLFLLIWNSHLQGIL